MRRPKLRDTIKNPRYEGIFIELFNINQFEWLTRKFANTINYEYYILHSGDKLVSKILLTDEFSSRLVTEEYPDSFVITRDDKHYIITDSLIDKMKSAAQVIFNKFGDKWNRIYALLVEEQYNPIHNYNMKEIISSEKLTSNTRKQKTKVTTSLGTSSYTYGYNSATETPTDKVASNNTISGNLDDNIITDNGGDESTITTEKSGNIGVTTTQKMVVDELDIRLKNIFNDIIFKDVDSILCLSVY